MLVCCSTDSLVLFHIHGGIVVHGCWKQLSYTRHRESLLPCVHLCLYLCWVFHTFFLVMLSPSTALDSCEWSHSCSAVQYESTHQLYHSRFLSCDKTVELWVRYLCLSSSILMVGPASVSPDMNLLRWWGMCPVRSHRWVCQCDSQIALPLLHRRTPPGCCDN